MKQYKNIICLACLLSSLVSYSPAQGGTLRETFAHIKGFWRHPANVGALLPCSSAVGEEIVTYLVQFIQDHPGQPIRVLEAGAGIGPMTEVIAKHIRDIDSLDVIEIDPEYCAILQDKFEHYCNISIHCTSIIDFHSSEPYDFIISTLPFNSFEYEFTKTIINHLEQLIKPGGVLSYVAYVGTAEIKKLLLLGRKKQEYKKNMELLQEWRDRYQTRKKIIFAHFPPINIYHLQISKS